MSEAEAIDVLVEEAKRLNGWLGDVAVLDMSEIVADGGVTAAQVVGQEAGWRQRRLRDALQAVFNARLASHPSGRESGL